MVIFLASDVIPDDLHLRKAHGKHAIAVLPGEIPQFRTFGFEPESGAAFDLFDHSCRFAGTGEGAKKVDMICHAAGYDGLAIVIGQDAAKIKMEFIPEGWVA